MPAAAERRSRRRATVYGDEAEAAEDAAFLLFRAWGMPVDSRLYVTSAAFGGKHVGAGDASWVGASPGRRGRLKLPEKAVDNVGMEPEQNHSAAAEGTAGEAVADWVGREVSVAYVRAANTSPSPAP
ncbi:MAG: hypothetical protein M3Q60_18600 [Actinomycetota bacterium]|nr:hypothetical protein [Actinomycetota bacterium]